MWQHSMCNVLSEQSMRIIEVPWRDPWWLHEESTVVIEVPWLFCSGFYDWSMMVIEVPWWVCYGSWGSPIDQWWFCKESTTVIEVLWEVCNGSVRSLQWLMRFCERSAMILWGVCNGYWGPAMVLQFGSMMVPQGFCTGSTLVLCWLLSFCEGSILASWGFHKIFGSFGILPNEPMQSWFMDESMRGICVCSSWIEY